MSHESVKQVIGRAVVEPEFRELLIDEPDKALAEYDLTEEESSSLSAVTREAFDAISTELEERVSRAGLGLGAMADTSSFEAIGGLGEGDLFISSTTFRQR